jgi:hypothetical protein
MRLKPSLKHIGIIAYSGAFRVAQFVILRSVATASPVPQGANWYVQPFGSLLFS